MKKPTVLASLTATYTDSEGEPDSEEETSLTAFDYKVPSRETTPSSQDVAERRKQVSKLVSYTDGGWEDDEGRDDSDFDDRGDTDDSENDRTPIDHSFWEQSPASFHRSLVGLKPHEIKLPPVPPGRCSNSLQEKISELYEKKTKEGKDMNATIQKKKNFRNPSIYEKLINYCAIDELGTNYPLEIYDPHSWGAESYYDELAKRQKEEMDKREKEKKERTKVEFISGTAKKPTAEISGDNKRKSKWDIGASQTAVLQTTLKPATLVNPTSVLPVTAATGTKPTVISAFGTISKKSKQSL